MPDVDDAFTLEYSPADGLRRRIDFEPRAGLGAGWFRIERQWTGCRWRAVGREPVDDVVVER